MAELANSQRIFYKAAYVPTRTSADSKGNPSRVADKISYLRSVNIKPDEFARLRSSPVGSLTCGPLDYPGNPYGPSATPLLLDVIQKLTTDLSLNIMSQYGPLLRNVSSDELAGVGNALVAIRKKAMSNPTPRSKKRGIGITSEQLGIDPGACTQTLVNGFVDRFTIEPVGRLHLERLEMTPVGIEHGELVHSVPLTPKETVNVSHREWAVTTSTFENIVQDMFQGYSETGVTDKTDLTQATDAETKRSSALDVNAGVNASYNGGTYSVSASSGIDYKAASDEHDSEKVSRAHSMAITRSASARTLKDHKFSFRVSSVAGTEDLAVRVLTNPSDTAAMRVDYYQLLRRWRVDLIRYGLRMTYDIVIPNPGADLIEKLYLIKQLDDQIAKPFGFDLVASTLSDQTLPDALAKYGGNVDPPMQAQMTKLFSGSIPYRDKANRTTIDSLEFDIDDNYEIKSCRFDGTYADWSDGGHDNPDYVAFFVVGAPGPNRGTADAYTTDIPALVGQSGHITIQIVDNWISTASMTATVVMKLKDAVLKAWQLKTWMALRESSLEAYTQARSALQDQRKQLADSIGAWDALTLRKMEREEIMRGVLRWLFGPSFELVPAEIENLYSSSPTVVGEYVPTVQCDEQWERVMKYGEFIKYINNAIEWENVIFFPYPYFWDAIQNWEFKRFLMHPDPQHRTFLRAGCARVVLTIRPGFEESFASLLETGSFNQTMTGSEYVDIGNEIRNYDMTNYGGIPPANPDHNVRLLLYPKQQRAWADMQLFMQALGAYFDANKAYPPTLSDAGFLTWVQQNMPAGFALPANLDPWNRPYQYAYPGSNGPYDLASYGANGDPGGDDLDADITSWAEGSVIGRWYEYTPTSALDVGITMLPPGPQLPAPQLG